MLEKHSAIILLYNNKHELALQLRSKHEENYPLHWDFSAAGGIEANEEPLIAAHRELKEELGIETELTYIDTKIYQDDTSLAYCYFYRGNYDGEFEPNANEVEEVGFFSHAVIQTMIDSRQNFHPEFLYFWQTDSKSHLFLNKKE